MLVVMAAIYLLARAFSSVHPAVGFVRAFAEAAMVGGLADWFAVTALFRHPLGLPIPHNRDHPAQQGPHRRDAGELPARQFPHSPGRGEAHGPARRGGGGGATAGDPERRRPAAAARRIAADRRRARGAQRRAAGRGRQVGHRPAHRPDAVRADARAATDRRDEGKPPSGRHGQLHPLAGACARREPDAHLPAGARAREHDRALDRPRRDAGQWASSTGSTRCCRKRRTTPGIVCASRWRRA